MYNVGIPQDVAEIVCQENRIDTWDPRGATKEFLVVSLEARNYKLQSTEVRNLLALFHNSDYEQLLRLNLLMWANNNRDGLEKFQHDLWNRANKAHEESLERVI